MDDPLVSEFAIILLANMPTPPALIHHFPAWQWRALHDRLRCGEFSSSY